VFLAQWRLNLFPQQRRGRGENLRVAQTRQGGVV
jgi:hypothetical protein